MLRKDLNRHLNLGPAHLAEGVPIKTFLKHSQYPQGEQRMAANRTHVRVIWYGRKSATPEISEISALV